MINLKPRGSSSYNINQQFKNKSERPAIYNIIGLKNNGELLNHMRDAINKRNFEIVDKYILNLGSSNFINDGEGEMV